MKTLARSVTTSRVAQLVVDAPSDGLASAYYCGSSSSQNHFSAYFFASDPNNTCVALSSNDQESLFDALDRLGSAVTNQDLTTAAGSVASQSVRVISLSPGQCVHPLKSVLGEEQHGSSRYVSYSFPADASPLGVSTVFPGELVHYKSHDAWGSVFVGTAPPVLRSVLAAGVVSVDRPLRATVFDTRRSDIGPIASLSTQILCDPRDSAEREVARAFSASITRHVSGTDLDLTASQEITARLPSQMIIGVLLTALVLAVFSFVISILIQRSIHSISKAVRELTTLSRTGVKTIPDQAEKLQADTVAEDESSPTSTEKEDSHEASEQRQDENEDAVGASVQEQMPRVHHAETFSGPTVQHVIAQAVPAVAHWIAELRARDVPQSMLEAIASRLMTMFAVGGYTDELASTFRATEASIRERLSPFSGQLAELSCGTAVPPPHGDAYQIVKSVIEAFGSVAALPDDIGSPSPPPDAVGSLPSFGQAIRECHMSLVPRRDTLKLKMMNSLQRSDYVNELRWYLLESSLSKTLGLDIIVELSTSALNEARHAEESGNAEAPALYALVEMAFLAEVIDNKPAPSPSDITLTRLNFGIFQSSTQVNQLANPGRLEYLSRQVDTSWYSVGDNSQDARVVWPLDRPNTDFFPPSYTQPNGGSAYEMDKTGTESSMGLVPLARTLFNYKSSSVFSIIGTENDSAESGTENDNLGRLLFERMLRAYQKPGSQPLFEGAVVRDTVKRLALCLQTFSRHVPACVVSDLLRDASQAHVGTQPGNVTIFVLDLASFTTLTEKLNQQQIHTMLSAAFEVFCTHINRHRGFVNKFAGDAVIAFWNAPHPVDHPELRCVLTALACAESLRALNRTFTEHGWPAIQIRIGIAQGVCLFGNVGYSERFDFSVIGLPVERAQRLEGFNKSTGTVICVDENVWRATHNHILYRPLDSISVDRAELPDTAQGTGDVEPALTKEKAYMMVYEPICHRSAVTPERQRFADSFDLCLGLLQWGYSALAQHMIQRHEQAYPWDRAIDVAKRHLADMTPSQTVAEPHYPEQFSSICEMEYDSYDSIQLNSAGSSLPAAEGIPTLSFQLRGDQVMGRGHVQRTPSSRAGRSHSRSLMDVSFDLPPPNYDQTDSD